MQTTTTPRRSFAGGLYTRGALLGFHERGLDAAAAKAVRASEGWSRQEVSACVDLPLPEL